MDIETVKIIYSWLIENGTNGLLFDFVTNNAFILSVLSSYLIWRKKPDRNFGLFLSNIMGKITNRKIPDSGIKEKKPLDK